MKLLQRSICATLLCTATALMATTVQATPVPIEVAINSKPNPASLVNGELAYVIVTSVSDYTVIKKVTLNKGNCKIAYWRGHGGLKYGQELIGLIDNCSSRQIKRIDVKTDKGDFYFTF